MNRIKELMSRLSPAKRREAQAQLGDRLAGAVQPPVAATGPLVSDNQRRLWALHRAGAAAAYTVSCAYRIEGPLRIQALREALRELTHRHEVLRTGYMERAGELVGLVHPVKDILAVVDTRSLPEQGRAAFVTRCVESQSRYAFDFDGEPMLHVILYAINSQTHVLQIAIHHIVCDQWSLEVMRRDLFALYSAFSSGQTPAHAPVRAAVPLLAWGAEDETFWMRSLSGAAHYPDLPFDRLPTSENSWQGERRRVSYGELGERVAQFAAGNNCTVFHVLLAAQAIAYSRWVDSHDVCIGTRVAGRIHESTADALGFFVNMLPIRLRWSADETVRQWLERTRDTSIAVLEREQAPFEALLNLLDAKRDPFLTPLIPLTLTYQNIPQLDAQQIGGLAISEIPHHNGTAKGELDLAFEAQGSALALVVEYRSALFDWNTLSRLIDEHKTILTFMLAHPASRLGELESELSAADRKHSILSGESVATAQGSLAGRLTGSFAAHAGLLAVADGERTLTFAQLDLMSARVAAALLARTDAASAPAVAIQLTAGVDWVVAALGCLRAGVPYLALDPADPETYRESVRQAAQCKLVIGSEALTLESLCAAPGAGSTATLPDIPATSLRPAYLLYTSGSTGAPKIVSVPHLALFNCIDSMMRAYPFAAGDVIGMRTKPTFAPAIKQWLGAVLGGLPVVVLPASLQGAAALAARIREAAITRLYLVPTQIRDLAHHLRGESQPLETVRLLTTGGEPLLPELLEDVRLAFPKTRLLNNYGCSELADITFNDVNVAPDAIAVGTPIDNTSVYLLRDDLEHVGAGAVGQIFVAGAALGNGYIGRADLTAAAYLPDPFSTQPGARMFRTGDYGRVDSHGRLIHGGRRDQQLKVNGCRVDAGHVASVLLGQPLVQRALALTRPGRQGEELLVAYVTPRLTPAGVVAVRRYLLTRLPHSMQPGAIVSLDAFPLLANGKIDRLSLAAPDWDAVSTDRVAPRSPTERAVAQIWKEVLEAPEVGVDDNFFNLGGHSILVIRVLVQIKATFGIELSQATFFQAPTIAELAARLESQGAGPLQGADGNATASGRDSREDVVT